MTTVVNNPAPAADSGGSGFLIGTILIIGLIILVFYFGIPAMKRMGSAQVNVAAPQVVVPDKIDVNVSQDK